MEKDQKIMTVISNSEKSIPKYATNVAISKLTNGSIIFTFIFQIPKLATEKEEAGQPGNIIETIIVDDSHAQKILGALDEAIKTNITKNE